MLRASAQHAVRAPNVEEFFRASLLRVQPFLDPCSSRYRGASTDRDAELALARSKVPTLDIRKAVHQRQRSPTVTRLLDPEGRHLHLWSRFYF